MNICLYGASSKAIDKKYITAIEQLGETLALRGHNLVFGGGQNGCMGAVARGAKRKNVKEIISIVPKFFNVDGMLFDGATTVIRPDTMRDRKRLLEDYSNAFIIAPGGIGTLDEFFEIITLKQLGRMNKPIVIYNVDNYYTPLIALLENAVKGEFMTKESLTLYKVFDNDKDIFDYIENYDEPLRDLSEFKKIVIEK